MKKIFFISVLGLFGCGTNRTYVQQSESCLTKHSDVLIASCDTSVVYIIKNPKGDMIAEHCWEKDCNENKTKVVRLDSLDFEELSKKSKPCTCYQVVKK